MGTETHRALAIGSSARSSRFLKGLETFCRTPGEGRLREPRNPPPNRLLRAGALLDASDAWARAREFARARRLVARARVRVAGRDVRRGRTSCAGSQRHDAAAVDAQADRVRVPRTRTYGALLYTCCAMRRAHVGYSMHRQVQAV